MSNITPNISTYIYNRLIAHDVARSRLNDTFDYPAIDIGSVTISDRKIKIHIVTKNNIAIPINFTLIDFNTHELISEYSLLDFCNDLLTTYKPKQLYRIATRIRYLINLLNHS